MSLYRTDEDWRYDAGPSDAEIAATLARKAREAEYAEALEKVRTGEGHCPLLARAVRLGHHACFWTPYPEPGQQRSEAEYAEAWAQALLTKEQQQERKKQVARLDQTCRPDEWVVQTYIEEGALPLRYRSERKELQRWLETVGCSKPEPVINNPFAALAAWRTA